MRHIFRLTFLAVIMTLSCLPVKADKYSRAWKKVDLMIEKDLPQSAAGEIEHIWDMAARDGNSRQMLKSACYMTRVESGYGENGVSKGIELFCSLLPKLKVKEHRAICHAFIAKGYQSYLNQNRNRLRDNRTYDSTDGLEDLTAAQLCDSIMYHLEQSITLAGDVASGYYKEFFPGSNKDGLKLRPTLADMLLDNATVLITEARLPLLKRDILSDSRLYGSSMDFLEATLTLDASDPDLWPLYVLKLLTSHNNDTKPIIRATVDMRRMSLLSTLLSSNGEWSKSSDDWLQGCIALGDSYRKKLKASTMFYEMAARRIVDYRYGLPRDRQAEYMQLAHKACELAIKHWPKSEGAYSCMNILDRIESKSVQIKHSGDMVPGRANFVALEYANTDVIYMRVAEVAGQPTNVSEYELLSQIGYAQSVSEWTVHVDNPKDYLSHAALAEVTPLMEGCYYIVASTGPNFSAKDNISYQYVECNSIDFIRAIANDGAIRGVAVNLRTGKPIADCRYTLWNLDGNGAQVKVATSGFAASDGYISMEGLKNGRYKLELDREGKTGNCELSVPWVRKNEQNAGGILYTDRGVYLPGDSVQFSIISYMTDGYENGHTLNGCKVELEIMDPDYRVIKEMQLVTDSMGLVCSSVQIGRNALPGSYHIQASIVGNEQSGSVRGSVNGGFRVESFRQPKFKVELEPMDELLYPGQEFTVKGKAVSYTGVPVSGATVKWQADIPQYSIHRLCVLNARYQYGADSGELVTDTDGCFSFPVNIPMDVLMDDNYSVSVTATVTDLNGETHDGSYYYEVGDGNHYVMASVQGRDAGGNYIVRMNLTNGKGNIHLEVERLEWPEKPLIPLDLGYLEDYYKKEITQHVQGTVLPTRFPELDFNLTKVMEPVEKIAEADVECQTNSSCTYRLLIPRSGYYRIKASADGYQTSEQDILLTLPTDSKFVPDGPDDRLWAECDLPRSATMGNCYMTNAGDTVYIRYSYAFAGAQMWYFVESRDGITDRGTVQAGSRQQALAIPVTDQMKGTFSVHLGVLYEGLADNRTVAFDVTDNAHRLNVELENADSIMEPDSPQAWTVKVSDSHGKPVSATLMVDMYDQSLDSYAYHNWRFGPWRRIYPEYRNIAANPYRYSSMYNPSNYSKTTSEYTGKRAITGNLINPFEYTAPSIRLRGQSVLMKSNSIALRESDVVSAEESLQASVDGLDYLSDSQILNDGNNTDNIPALRSDMNPTGLYRVGLRTDSTGVARIEFSAPQLLTSWRLQGFAYTDSLSSGQFADTLITRKELMIEPSAPRFLRQGDVVDFTQKVTNLSKTAVNASVTLDITDALTGNTLRMVDGSSRKTVSIPAGGSAQVSFRVRVPKDAQAITYTSAAKTTGNSDAVRETIPVLSNRMQVVQSLSLFNNGNEKRSFDFSELSENRSQTMDNERLILEYSSSPIWYAIQSLPYVIKTNDISNIGLNYSLFGAAITRNILERNPEIGQVLEEWKKTEPTAWEKQLEQNAALTETLENETPWTLRDGNSHLRRLAMALDSAQIDQAMETALARLADEQLQDGGWSWMSGGSSNIYVTAQILQSMGILMENGAVNLSREIKEALAKGLEWLDSQYAIQSEHDSNLTELTCSQLDWLLIRTYYSQALSGKSRTAYNRYASIAISQATHDMDIYSRARLALYLARTGKADDAARVAATLVERSLYDEEMGRYWRDNQGGFLWHEAPIETQALIIRAILSTGRNEEATQAARWLLKQKQTSGWGSSPATAQAVVALLATGGNRILETTPDVTITVGRNIVKADTSRVTAGYTTATWDKVSADMARISVDSRTEGISWGAVFRSFTEEMDKVEHSENGMTLKRTLWLVEPDGFRLIQKGTVLKAGDRVKVRFELTTDRAVEYVQLRDGRAATFEPVSTRAGYNMNRRDGIAYYTAPENTRNVFYIDRLEKGSYVIEYEVTVLKPGQFMVAPAVLQCLYAPAFRVTTSAQSITVE